MRISKLILFFAPVAALPVLAQTYVTFTVPGATSGTVPYAMNDNGDVTGSWDDQNGNSHGFLRTSAGVITTFDAPQSLATYPSAINDAGVIAGFFSTTNSVRHGFVRNAKGAIESFDPPGSTDTQVSGINASGQIAGYYSDSVGQHGFERLVDGTITTFTPGPDTLVYAINNAGAIAGTTNYLYVGFVRDPMGVFHIGEPYGDANTFNVAINIAGTVAGSVVQHGSLGFIRTSGGPTQTFAVSGSWTTVTGLNSSNSATGDYSDPQTGNTRSFVRHYDGTVVLIDCPGFPETYADGINATGMVAGYAVSRAIGSATGFIYTPAVPAAVRH